MNSLSIQGKNLIVSILLDRYREVCKKQFGTAEWECKVIAEALEGLGYSFDIEKEV